MQVLDVGRSAAVANSGQVAGPGRRHTQAATADLTEDAAAGAEEPGQGQEAMTRGLRCSGGLRRSVGGYWTFQQQQATAQQENAMSVNKQLPLLSPSNASQARHGAPL